jgi:uncharacterized coiled-coil DUF342 family protein
MTTKEDMDRLIAGSDAAWGAMKSAGEAYLQSCLRLKLEAEGIREAAQRSVMLYEKQRAEQNERLGRVRDEIKALREERDALLAELAALRQANEAERAEVGAARQQLRNDIDNALAGRPH